uniref:Uncharacterized protein n=1 Tax=Pseudomonas fluorescens (strain SBW25) TaxID=216595 RepID=A0A0G4E4M1_PSEFS|nr:hypothetical protein [Pseudomonas fluorescens]CEK42185.1 hypothetical protein PQBR57_0232 [Pseudomonas fluorescens SBW25]
MAGTQNTPNITLPQRSITITGPMTARLFQASVRVSRIDLRATQVALAHPSVRDPSNRAIKQFEAALARFESEMTVVEKDLDNAGRTAPPRRNSQQNQNPQSRKPVREGRAEAAADASGGAGGATIAKSATQSGGNQKQAAPGQGKGPRSRNKNRGNAAPAASATKQPAQQSEVAPTAATAQPVVVTAAPAPAPVQPQSTPQADVPADIQAL